MTISDKFNCEKLCSVRIKLWYVGNTIKHDCLSCLKTTHMQFKRQKRGTKLYFTCSICSFDTIETTGIVEV